MVGGEGGMGRGGRYRISQFMIDGCKEGTLLAAFPICIRLLSNMHLTLIRFLSASPVINRQYRPQANKHA